MEKYNNFLVPGAIIIVGILVAGAIVYGPVFREAEWFTASLSGSPRAESPSIPSALVKVQVTEQDHVRGNVAAPVTIVEFSDLECPFCKSFHPTVKQALAEYGDRVRWIYKHFPIDSRHPKADKEAEAAECAGALGGNGMFWKYVDRVFEITPSNNGLNLALLPQIAQDLGLNRVAFEACLNSGTYADRVEADYQYGVSLGVNGTPGSFVNGIPVQGAVPYGTLKAAIDEALAQ